MERAEWLLSLAILFSGNKQEVIEVDSADIKCLLYEHQGSVFRASVQHLSFAEELPRLGLHN